MNIADIPESDLATLKADGYTEADLAHLALTEIQSLLPSKEDADAAAAEAAEATAKAAAVVPSEGGQITTPAAEEDVANAAAFVPQYKVEVPADADEKIKALRTEEKAAFKKLMDGEMDADEYQAIRERTDAEADDLKTKVLSASIFQQANQQATEQQAATEWQRAETRAMESFKAEGLDYKGKPALLAAYNTHLKALGADAKNENRDAPWFLSEAHKLTMADLGIQPAAKKVVPPASARVDTPELPPTLRGAPSSATGAVNTDEFAHMRNLEGLELERAHARLSPEQRDRWMAE